MQALTMRGRLFKIYQNALLRRPYLVQAVQTGALMGAGDIISQTFVEHRSLKVFDYKRTLKFASIGLFIGVSSFSTKTEVTCPLLVFSYFNLTSNLLSRVLLFEYGMDC